MKISELEKLAGHAFVLDLETTGLRWWEDGIIGIGIYCPSLGIHEYIQTCTYEERPVGKLKTKTNKIWTGRKVINPLTGKKVKEWEYETVTFQKTRIEAVPIRAMAAEALEVLSTVANHPKTFIIGHNVKFDLHFVGLDLWAKPCGLVDTMTMIHLYDSRLPKSLEAGEMLFLHGASKRQHKTTVPLAWKNKPWLWSLEQVTDYCKNDCLVTWQLGEVLFPKLRKLKLNRLFENQMVYLRALWQMERTGMELDQDYCKASIEKLASNVERMEADLWEEIGYEFNWRSPDQLSEAIYDNYDYDKPISPYAYGKRAKAYESTCTAKEVIASHPLGDQIQDLREAYKLKGNLITYLNHMDQSGLVHPNFNPLTRTGRLNCREPNLQNIASEKRKRISASQFSDGGKRKAEYNTRQAFKAREGFILFSCDHAQQELRLLAILANEPKLIAALATSDLHMVIALKAFGDHGPELNEVHRNWSKAISFAAMYGMSTETLAESLHKTLEETYAITDTYWGAFPGLRPYMATVIERLEANNRVRFWSGRIWREEDESKFYVGINAEVQGGAADLIGLATIRAQTVLQDQDWGSTVAIVHDEDLFHIRLDCVDRAVPVLLKIMELEDVFGIPFRAEGKLGFNYGAMKKLETIPDLTNVDWRSYCKPGTDFERLTLKAWEAGKF